LVLRKKQQRTEVNHPTKRCDLLATGQLVIGESGNLVIENHGLCLRSRPQSALIEIEIEIHFQLDVKPNFRGKEQNVLRECGVKSGGRRLPQVPNFPGTKTI